MLCSWILLFADIVVMWSAIHSVPILEGDLGLFVESWVKQRFYKDPKSPRNLLNSVQLLHVCREVDCTHVHLNIHVQWLCTVVHVVTCIYIVYVNMLYILNCICFLLLVDQPSPDEGIAGVPQGDHSEDQWTQPVRPQPLFHPDHINV